MATFAEAILPILVLASIAGAADLFGGWLALRREHLDDPRYVIAFSSGIVTAAVFFELLPESFEGLEGGQLQLATLVMALGFFVFYVVEKVIMLHACGEPECTTHAYSPTMVIGMASDNVIDGVGIAIGFLLDPLLGIVITLVVVAHEVPQGITTAELLKHANFPKRKIVTVLCAAAAAYVVGAMLAGFIGEDVYKQAIAFVTGTFIYVGAADLMGEAHRKFNKYVVASVIAGAVLMGGLTIVEGLV